MAAVPQSNGAAVEAIPDLGFSVLEGRAVEHAAVPTIAFRLRVEGPPGLSIRSVLLDVQIQIAARLRGYDEAAEAKLADLFGTPDRWATTLRTLPWMRTTVVVPQFTGSTEIEVPIVCTYDLEVSASQYLQALEDGEVPLEFLFSGTVFYAGADGALQTARISWEREAEYAMPAAVWREAIDRHFPGAAWLRVSRETFDRLHEHRLRNGHRGWDDAIYSLLSDSEQR